MAAERPSMLEPGGTTASMIIMLLSDNFFEEKGLSLANVNLPDSRIFSKLSCEASIIKISFLWIMSFLLKENFFASMNKSNEIKISFGFCQKFFDSFIAKWGVF
ncbi:hypothetical protein [Legionella tunisiensis]|uniref:hypothetical protein n=1 Tax=Legionella tunisiensis TaxID=1034944 RepID=UPI001E6135DE|nr:hypothetical protein [Legionella tunisiensis]